MYIIAELHGQLSGKIDVAERMLLECKTSGAHAAKVQLYDPMALNGHRRHQYLSLTFDQLKSLKAYADMLRIDFLASFFDEERLDWCLKLELPILKIASTVLKRYPNIAEKAVASGRRTIISLGMHDWKIDGFPFDAPNVEYLYCIAKYPATLEDVDLPDFAGSRFAGYSDHTIGISACQIAIVKGARIIEKHYTISHSLQKETEKGHLGSFNAAQLAQLRNFWEDCAVLRREGPAYDWSINGNQ